MKPTFALATLILVASAATGLALGAMPYFSVAVECLTGLVSAYGLLAILAFDYTRRPSCVPRRPRTSVRKVRAGERTPELCTLGLQTAHL